MTIIYCRPIVKLPEEMFINYTVTFTFMAMTETELKTFTNKKFIKCILPHCF